MRASWHLTFEPLSRARPPALGSGNGRPARIDLCLVPHYLTGGIPGNGTPMITWMPLFTSFDTGSITFSASRASMLG